MSSKETFLKYREKQSFQNDQKERERLRNQVYIYTVYVARWETNRRTNEQIYKEQIPGGMYMSRCVHLLTKEDGDVIIEQENG